MATTNLAQQIADALLAMEKHRETDEIIPFVRLGQSESIQLVSADESEDFLLDLVRGRQSFVQLTMQNRARKEVPLARLDINGPPHRNPRCKEFIYGPHLHLYRENFKDRWAKPAPTDIFSDLDNELITLREFMSFCNISKPPNIKLQGGLSI